MTFELFRAMKIYVVVSCLLVAPKMEALYSSESAVSIYQTTLVFY
jgi:hypothetical protein